LALTPGTHLDPLLPVPLLLSMAPRDRAGD
jgi:hypothetical protein